MRAAIIVFAAVLLSTASVAHAGDAASIPSGLYYRNGEVMHNDRAFRGIGANYFSLFSRMLANPEDKSALTNLAALHRANIPFVRFMCGGYWPVEQQLHLKNPDAFFSRLDEVVQAAERNQIGLIPSLFWHLPTVCDLAGEPMDSLGDTNSKSIAYIRRYTEEIVLRYRHSPAIWAWEFGNEPALGVDLPNASEHRPPVVPSLGTPRERSGRDELTSAQLHVAYTTFAETVRKLDANRLIFSGNAFPRNSAWHNTHEKSWKADTADQFGDVLLRDNPDPMNAISVHLYPADSYPAGARTIDTLVSLTARIAKEANKPLFIGEFGAAHKNTSRDETSRTFAEMIAAIEKNRVPLAAFWVFDYPAQEADWNIAFHNDRAYLLEAVTAANARLIRR